MAKRSLKASSTGIQTAKRAFERREWTQEYLASTVGLQTRQSVWKFFTGRPIERYLFIDICFQLNLDWEEIADLPRFEEAEVKLPKSPNPKSPNNANELSLAASDNYLELWNSVKTSVKERLYNYCNTLIQLRDLPEAVSLANLYIERNVIETYKQDRWLAARDFYDRLNYPNHADFREMPFRYTQTPLGYQNQPKTGVEVRSIIDEVSLKDFLLKKRRLCLLGKAGAGKSVTLQGLSCHLNSSGELDFVSCFLPLRSVDINSESLDLILIQVLKQQGFTELTPEFWQYLCHAGKVCLLLDGLNEVPQKDRKQLAMSIQDLTSRYPNLLAVVSNRHTKPNDSLQGFYSVTLADFNDTQIRKFVRQWFDATTISSSPTSQSELRSDNSLSAQYAETFLHQISRKENHRLYNIGKTPLLLHLLCLHFYFQQELPRSKTRFYSYILEILLDPPNASYVSHLESPSVAASSHSESIHLFGQIALRTFQHGNYFFEKSQLIEIISHHVAHADPQSNRALEINQIWHRTNCLFDSFIESQDFVVEIAQGIYAFSQPVLQEYLCALTLAHGLLIRKNSAEESNSIFQQWTDSTLQSRWYEALYLALEILPDPKPVLLDLQTRINIEIKLNAKEHNFLCWVSSRSLQMSQRVHTLPVSVIRAIYFGAALELGFDLAYMLYPNLSIDLPKELSDDIALMQLISRIPSLVATPNLPEAIDFTFKLQVVASTIKTDTLWVKMQTLQDKIAHSQLNHWSESDRITWGVNLQNELSEQLEFTGEWLSSEEDLAQLERYYWANIFFLKCQEKFNQVPDFFHFISGKTLCYPG